MKGIVIYESLTGNTRDAGILIAEKLSEAGVETVASSTKQIDYQALSEADLVVVGSWTDGLFVMGQRPGGISRLANLPVIDGKTAAVYCTYALAKGKTLDTLSGIVSRRGGNVIGGQGIRRDRIEEGVNDFVTRLVGALNTAAAE